jgi:hypothetical protein
MGIMTTPNMTTPNTITPPQVPSDMVIEELLSQIKDLALQNAILASMVKTAATTSKTSEV